MQWVLKVLKYFYLIFRNEISPGIPKSRNHTKWTIVKVAVTVNKEKIFCSNGRCRQQPRAASHFCTQIACSLCTNKVGISNCII